ncbi:aminomethyltransferase family protein [Pontiella sulfatireligans]|uniref:GCVT N-terminal domain-containing protein n=1 Tax=Pontiella sulfatireligans TaxID=2750658 RepID=A0A6C2UJQ7_9BACT|nr:hypothetical protein [Pontiella sulfatireligans]VGO20455.1 hypothetical protein SCARR_02518 [Pontiella sulfatireligans]
MIKPSPFVASTVPGKVFDPKHHVAFSDVFLARHMSPFEDEMEAITLGAGLPDRGDQGWIALGGKDVLQVIEGVPVDLPPGGGVCGVWIEALSDEPIDLYAGTDQLWIGLLRILVQTVVSRLHSVDVSVTDETDRVARMAVMGPDSRKLLQALGVCDDQLLQVGNHIEIEIIEEPVRVCRSDFAGVHGYDFIIPFGPFNMILAVICSWGVRLDMNLLPIGWNALQVPA